MSARACLSLSRRRVGLDFTQTGLTLATFILAVMATDTVSVAIFIVLAWNSSWLSQHTRRFDNMPAEMLQPLRTPGVGPCLTIITVYTRITKVIGLRRRKDLPRY
jgi:hypothetical protein